MLKESKNELKRNARLEMASRKIYGMNKAFYVIKRLLKSKHMITHLKNRPEYFLDKTISGRADMNA